MLEPIVCTPKRLPSEQWMAAAVRAIQINPMNRAPVERLVRVDRGFKPTKAYISVLTTKYWHTNGAKLTVGFLDNPPPDLRARIILHMNAWDKTANVAFTETNTDPQVRIARAAGDDGGYWSFLGTEILEIEPDKPTMNLESFTMQTPDSEFHRVVRHETGHTLGFPHEHMRKELVDQIDPDKAIQYFEANEGWSKEEVEQQVLTPIEDSSLWGTAHADPNSIMCYQIPGAITKNHKPITGGLDIDDEDYKFAALVYPKPVSDN